MCKQPVDTCVATTSSNIQGDVVDVALLLALNVSSVSLCRV
jgi:hypothetical protein